MPPTISYVALLRGVNLAGHKPVSMAELRELALEIGLEEPRTLLQSGNLVFRAARLTAGSLERRLEAEIERVLSTSTRVLVRTAAEWRSIVERNPFPELARRDPSHLVMAALAERPEPARLATLRAAITGHETVALDGHTLYAVYPDGIGRSRLTTALIDRILGTVSTARNWNTVLKLGALLDSQ